MDLKEAQCVKSGGHRLISREKELILVLSRPIKLCHFSHMPTQYRAIWALHVIEMVWFDWQTTQAFPVVRTTSSGQSFYFHLWPKRKACEPWKQGRQKRGSITCRTDRANEANKMFIIWLCWLCRSQIQECPCPPPLPGLTPGHLTFFIFFGQIPHHAGPFFGQMPPLPKGFFKGSNSLLPRAEVTKPRLISGNLNEVFNTAISIIFCIPVQRLRSSFFLSVYIATT